MVSALVALYNFSDDPLRGFLEGICVTTDLANRRGTNKVLR